jgi:hypothetical protein
MTPSNTISVKDISLAARITIENDEGERFTGKVIELALLGDEMVDIQITLLMDDYTELSFARKPDTFVTRESFPETP